MANGLCTLGTDYGAAKRKCDEVVNPQFDGWRGKSGGGCIGAVPGSFDWMVATYKGTARYTELPPGTRGDYDRALRLVSDIELKDGRRFGRIPIASITGGIADKLFIKLKVKADGSPRVRTAVLSMTCCKLAWNAAHREKPTMVPAANPFANMSLKYTAEETRPVTHDELKRFVAQADLDGHASVGTAAMIAYYWLQRQVDILERLSWSHYRPAGRPVAQIWHHKTNQFAELPLYDDDGSELWPELMERLDATDRRGTLIVIRDQADRQKKTHLPWKADYFRHVVADIRSAAGIDTEAKFMGFRHGGNTEGADADLTDAQLRALSSHKATPTVRRYAKETMKQRRDGARKRRDARSKTKA